MTKKGDGTRKKTQYQIFQVRLKICFRMKSLIFHNFPPSQNLKRTFWKIKVFRKMWLKF